MAKASILELFAQYSSLGNVRVELVTFGTIATNETGTWVDIATAKDILLNLSTNGTTNYDDALNTAWNAFWYSGNLDAWDPEYPCSFPMGSRAKHRHRVA